MDDAMTLNLNFFKLCGYVLLIGLGIDFSISGYLTMVNNHLVFMRSKLLGVSIIRWVQTTLNKWQGNNKLVVVLYGKKTMAFYFLASGLSFLIVGSLLLLETVDNFHLFI